MNPHEPQITSSILTYLSFVIEYTGLIIQTCPVSTCFSLCTRLHNSKEMSGLDSSYCAVHF